MAIPNASSARAPNIEKITRLRVHHTLVEVKKCDRRRRKIVKTLSVKIDDRASKIVRQFIRNIVEHRPINERRWPTNAKQDAVANIIRPLGRIDVPTSGERRLKESSECRALPLKRLARNTLIYRHNFQRL